MIGRNLGRGATLLLDFTQRVVDLHEDLDRFNAPSEIHSDLRRSNARAFRMVKRRIKAVTGLKYPVFLRTLTARTSARWVHFNLETWTHDVR